MLSLLIVIFLLRDKKKKEIQSQRSERSEHNSNAPNVVQNQINNIELAPVPQEKHSSVQRQHLGWWML